MCRIESIGDSVVFKTSRIHTHETTSRILMIRIKRSPEYLDIIEIVGVLTSEE